MLLITIALFVAFSNGANDNFKGFATVWGSDTLNYRQALTLATLATVAGSLASVLLAETLVQQFSGKGLVPDAVANAPWFIMSVASGAAATVFLATRLGFPVSTTHALIGGLIGAGLGQGGGEVHFDKLTQTFLLPLLVSPLLAALLGLLVYRLLRLRPLEKDCACLIAPPRALIAAASVVFHSVWNLSDCSLG
jgi:PiT family inorganic phosphate transporter